MVRVLLNLDRAPGGDAADALAIAICHINTLGPNLRA
jgi:Holliday junction resolvasome RuvABC endonuclease subunit